MNESNIEGDLMVSFNHGAQHINEYGGKPGNP